MARLPCADDLLGCEFLSLLDIPHDVRIYAIALPGEQVAAQLGKKKCAQHLKTLDCTRKVRRSFLDMAAHFGKAMHSGPRNARDLPINASEAEIRAECEPPRRACMPQRGLKSLLRDAA